MSFGDTDIRWTDKTWNPVHGCSKTSEGCANCYAERVSRRFGHTDHDWTPENAEANVQLKEHYLGDRLEEPNWVFVNSMSDLFHPEVPMRFVEDVLEACSEMPNCAFQVLTKHGPDTCSDVPAMPKNVMLGVSVESERRTHRIDWLREQSAMTKFVSFEPLVEPVDAVTVDLEGIDWAIIGGESGPDDVRREMVPRWASALVHACWDQDVAVFFKQHSGRRPESDVELDIDGERQRIEEFPDMPRGVAPAPREFLEVTA